jgi:sarcosine oxidase delta subunit
MVVVRFGAVQYAGGSHHTGFVYGVHCTKVTGDQSESFTVRGDRNANRVKAYKTAQKAFAGWVTAFRTEHRGQSYHLVFQHTQDSREFFYEMTGDVSSRITIAGDEAR